MKTLQNKDCGVILLTVIIILFLSSCCYTKKEYYSNFEGKERVRYIYQINRISGKKCGKFIWLSEQGDTIEVSNFKNDKLNGFVRHYFEGGNLQLEAEFLNDMEHGITKEFYENGQLRCKLLYKIDKLWEIEAVYDSSGNPLDYGELVEGNGFVKIFYPNGQVEYEGTFENGVRSGYWEFFTESGSVIDSIKYQDGYREGSITIANKY